jgi:hypothetical protein
LVVDLIDVAAWIERSCFLTVAERAPPRKPRSSNGGGRGCGASRRDGNIPPDYVWAIAISGFAAAGTVANFLFTQWRTDRREINKWRRDELLKLTSAMLQLSRTRQTALVHNYEVMLYQSPRSYVSADSEDKLFQMEVVVEQIRLLDSRLSKAAVAVYELHRDAERQLIDVPDDGDQVGQIEALLVDQDRLDELHADLVAHFSSAMHG